MTIEGWQGGGEPIGHVVQMGGSKASLRLQDGDYVRREVTVGRFLGVETPDSIVVGVVTQVGLGARSGPNQDPTCSFDIMGELRRHRDGVRYMRGVIDYPGLGAAAHLLTKSELSHVVASPGHQTIAIGQIHQDRTIEARIRIDDMLKKHFAVLGSTGVGKSSGVAVLMREVMKVRPELRVFFIDAHNEYGSCFGARAEVLNPSNLKLPFWVFNFEEFVDVLFRGRPGLEEETAILAEAIPAAKAMWSTGRAGQEALAVRRPEARKAFGPDAPVPYRLADLVSVIEERRGKLDNRSVVSHHTRLLSRIEAVKVDPRYAFMFDAANVGGDTMIDVLSHLFHLLDPTRTTTVMQLAGFPSEVVDAVVSVVCRLAFEFGLWSDGAAQILVLCEEAHRYVPAEKHLGFGPTRKAISRIAKEGRKYGVYLGLVTQRPAELDQTIVSQCNTVFAMRMANERDQAIVRAAVSDAAASLLDFVPALGVQEVFAFGEGVPLPTRLRFHDLAAHELPRSEAVHRAGGIDGPMDREFLHTVVERWRGTIGGPRPKLDEGLSTYAARHAPPHEQPGGDSWAELNRMAERIRGASPNEPSDLGRRFGRR